jgi:hypothetical protein
MSTAEPRSVGRSPPATLEARAMATLATAGLAVFVLLLAAVCALASAARLALRLGALALVLATAAAAFAVIGQRRYRNCVDDAASWWVVPGQPSAAQRCRDARVWGLYDPF